MEVRVVRIVDALAFKEFKSSVMKNYDRDLLVLYKANLYNEDLLQHEVECLHQILLCVERNDVFCKAHDLVTRNRITTKPNRIIKAIREYNLKPFNFLINKN